MDKFREWLESKGVDFKTIEIFDFPTTRRGIRTNRPINKNGKIMAIPLGLIITAKVCHSNATIIKLGNSALKSGEKLTMLELLVIWLIEQKESKDSEWGPYINDKGVVTKFFV